MPDSCTLYENARIYTLDPELPNARAMLVCHGVVYALYSDPHPSVSGWEPLQRIDCKNLVLLPAFTDAHIHLMDTGKHLETVDVSSARSEGEAVEILKKASRDIPPGEWIRGARWVHNLWSPPHLPSKESLDKSFPQNPVFLFSKCGHLLWANSLALKAAGITKDTPDPPSGNIEKDLQTRQPTGIIKENFDLICKEIPPIPNFKKIKLLKKAAAYFNRFGFVNVHANEPFDTFTLLQQLRQDKEFPLNVVIFVSASFLDRLIAAKMQSGFGNDKLRFGGVKLFVDGSLGGRTAWMNEPYEHEPDNTGINIMTREELKEIIGKANNYGICTMTHAIGDRAVDTLIEVLFKIQKQNVPVPEIYFGNRVEHFQLLSENTLALLKSVKGVASVQPVHLFYDWHAADQFWGNRSRFAYAFHSLKNSGWQLVFGSDSPVEPINPFWGLYAAVKRQDLEGNPPSGWYPEEILPVDEALRAYCSSPPCIVGEESRKGTLSLGKRADFILTDHDPLTEPPEVWKNSRVLGTVYAGEFVFREF